MPKQILDSSNDIRDQTQQPLDSTGSNHCLAPYYKVGTVQVHKQGQLDITSCRNPDDGDGVHPWNDCVLETRDAAVGLRRFC